MSQPAPATPPSIQQLEQDILAAKRRLTDALRALPPQPIRDYTLAHVPSGSAVHLSELFGASRERPLRRQSGPNPCGAAPFGATSPAQLS